MIHVLFVVVTMVLLLTAAFLSGSETAVTGSSRAYLFHLAKKGDKRAKKVLELQEDMSLSIETILMLNQIVLFLIPTFTARYSLHLSPAQSTICTSVVAVLIIVYAEICPKILAIKFIIPFALFAAPAIKILVTTLKGLTRILEECAKLSLRLVGINIDAQKVVNQSDEELRGAIEMHSSVGNQEEEEQKKTMLKSILDLENIQVSQAMVHRKHLRTIDISLPTEKIAKEISSCPFSRIPLWKDSPENIVGILKAKTFFKAVQANKGDYSKIKISTLISAPWYIPETTSLLDQLENFRKKREHFALIVDEYGDLLGCITLEDILEEIVGEIVDEYDNKELEDEIRIQPDGSIIANGATPIRDLNRQFGWNIPEKGATTIAGYVMYETRKIPDVGQVYVFSGLKLQILRRQRNQIVLIKITPQPAQQNSADTPEVVEN